MKMQIMNSPCLNNWSWGKELVSYWMRLSSTKTANLAFPLPSSPDIFLKITQEILIQAPIVHVWFAVRDMTRQHNKQYSSLFICEIHPTKQAINLNSSHDAQKMKHLAAKNHIELRKWSQHHKTSNLDLTDRDIVKIH